MKYLCIFFILIFLPLSVFAQNSGVIEQFNLNDQNSLISLSEHNLGGFGGLNFKANFKDIYFILIEGISFGIMVKPSISIFASVNYLISDLDDLEVWFTGIGAEYILFPYSWSQLYLYGQVSYASINFSYRGSSYQPGFFVLEPEILWGIRLTKFARIKLGIGYRIAAGISGLPVLTNRNCSGLYGVVRLSNGVFDPQERQKVLQSKERLNILSGNFSMKFTNLNHQFVILKGYGARLIINRKFAIGISHYNNISNAFYKGNELFIVYRGIWAHYITSPINRMHVSLSALTAVGYVVYVDEETDERIYINTVVLEPDLFLDINITEFMRLGLGVGYRFVPAKLEELDTWDLSSFSGTIQLRFGGF